MNLGAESIASRIAEVFVDIVGDSLGLLLDLPCVDVRRKQPPSLLLLLIPLVRVLDCLPRRVRVEILPSAKPQGREHVERLSAPLCAEQPRGRRGRGGASQGRMGVRARLHRQIHVHRGALRLRGRRVLPARRCVAWVMCGARA